jgi:hypothetical protein
MTRDDLKEVSTEDVYAITLIIKIFKCLITLIFVFHLKTRQFDVINVFLNVKIDRKIHVYMSNEYVRDDKCFFLIEFYMIFENRRFYN